MRAHTVATTGAIAVCVFISAHTLASLSHRLTGADAIRPSTSGQGRIFKLRGDEHKQFGIDYSSSRRTVLLLVDSGCPYSRKSLGFYRKLLAKTRLHSPGMVRVIAVSSEPKNKLEAFLRAGDVRPDGLMETSTATLLVQRTPTIVMVNAKGIVEQIWVGRLLQSEEESVLARIVGET